MTEPTRIARVAALSALVLGCSGTASTDGGPGRDAGRRDAGGAVGLDAGPGGALDAGPGGAVDAGPGSSVDGGGSDDAGAGADAGLVPPCVDHVVTRVGAAVVNSSTVGAGDDFSPLECDGGGPDELVLFVAPSTGSYVFDVDTDFDSVLSIHAPDCDEPKERFCADDVGDVEDPVLAVFLEAGERIFVNVDGLGTSGDEGDYELGVTRVADTCPDVELGSATGVSVGSEELLAGTADNRTASCTFGGGGRDLSFRWTALTTGDYTFTTETSVDTVLYLLDGDCGGDELACNDDTVLSPPEESAITTNIEAGQTVIIVVEGFDGTELGAFDLSISGPV